MRSLLCAVLSICLQFVPVDVFALQMHQLRNSDSVDFSIEFLDFTPVIKTGSFLEFAGEDARDQQASSATNFSLRLKVHNLSNRSKTPFLQLWMQKATPIARSDLDDWASGKTSLFSAKVFHSRTLDPLPSGGEQIVSLTVDVKDMPLNNSSQWGPRGLAASVRCVEDASEQLVQTRNWVLWDNESSFEPSQLAVLMPVTFSRTEQDLAYYSALKQIDEAGGLVDQHSTDSQDRPGSKVVVPKESFDPYRLTKLCKLAKNPYLSTLIDPATISEKPAWTGLRNLLIEPSKDPGASLSDSGTTPPSTQQEFPLNTSKIQSGNIKNTPELVNYVNSLSVAVQSCINQQASWLRAGDFSAAQVYASKITDPERSTLTREAQQLHKELTQLTKKPLSQGENSTPPAAAHAKSTGLELSDLALMPSLPSQDSIAAAQSAFSSASDTIQTVINNALDFEGQTWPNLPMVLPSEKNIITQSFDPSAYRKLNLKAGPRLALYTDFELGQAFQNQVPKYFSLTSGPIGQQWLLAQSAILTRQRPFDQRSFVIGLHKNASPTDIAHGLQALTLANWVKPISLAQLLKEKPDIETLPVANISDLQTFDNADDKSDSTLEPAYKNASSDVHKGHPATNNSQILAKASQALEFAHTFSTLLPQDSDFLDFSRQALLSAACSQISEEEDFERNKNSWSGLELVNRIQSSISMQPSSTINLIDKTAILPIAVTNALRVPVTVTVSLAPNDQRLQVSRTDTIQIAPVSGKSAHIPVAAIGSGDVLLRVKLLNKDGITVNQGSNIKVRVRAQWETTGTLVGAGVLSVLLILGIIRNIRKGKRRETSS